jgi:hypothetical protein
VPLTTWSGSHDGHILAMTQLELGDTSAQLQGEGRGKGVKKRKRDDGGERW